MNYGIHYMDIGRAVNTYIPDMLYSKKEKVL